MCVIVSVFCSLLRPSSSFVVPRPSAVLDLMYACGDDRSPLPESACVLEDILLEFLSTLCEQMLAVHPIPCSQDAVQVATQMSNSRDGSGLAATALSTAHGLRMDTLLFTLRRHPQHYQRVKELWNITLQQHETDGSAKKANRGAK